MWERKTHLYMYMVTYQAKLNSIPDNQLVELDGHSFERCLVCLFVCLLEFEVWLFLFLFSLGGVFWFCFFFGGDFFVGLGFFWGGECCFCGFCFLIVIWKY